MQGVPMRYDMLSDEEILHDLGRKLDLMRRHKALSDSDLIQKSGSNHDTLDRFRHAKSGISLKNFIRLVRGVGELEKLEKLFEIPDAYSPIGISQTEPPKKIHKKKNPKGDFIWGDDA